MGWPIIDAGERRGLEPISPWLFLVLTLMITTAGAVLTILLWPSGKPTANDTVFWLRLAVMPLLAAWTGCAAIVYIRDLGQYTVDLWNCCRTRLEAAWKEWAEHCVVTHAYSILTPEAELAERISGLNGTVPQNKGKVLKLDGFEADHDESRADKVVRVLLEPLVERLRRFGSNQTIEVVAFFEGDDDVASAKERLTDLWGKLALPGHAKFAVVRQLNWSNLEAFRVSDAGALMVLGVQLHDETAEIRRYTESAVAILFQREFDKNEDAKPLVRFFRSMHSEISSLKFDLQQFFEVGPYPASQLRFGWACGLDKAAGYALATSLNDAGAELKEGIDGMFRLDDYLGPLGSMSSWLAFALAAELVQCGQGTQLFASQDGAKIALLMAGTLSRQDRTVLEAFPVRSQIGSGQLILAVPLLIFSGLWMAKPGEPFLAYMALGATYLAIVLFTAVLPFITAWRCVSNFGKTIGYLPYS